MKKSKVLEFDKETIERIVTMAQEERKPFEVLKEEFGISENEVTEMVRKKLSKDNFELWKKKVAANKPKPKLQRYNELEDDDLDSKYYFKNKFD
ncbi:TIGR03643 family protein [Flavobacterium cerinum]|uniref:TIGR03643 family protein n=1 Tax=Flavobacterium cerinum TaxID=2502784 RepID=A0ABY5IXS0_9FLAO|nr:TIGR03643 family protein [Flavobacterium cerinum]UUC47075.1 TIGR03643 family protein [Flavobacterium cerinum]